MKKLILFITFIIAGGAFLFAQSVAVDFTANDCNGTSHSLQAELNAGKVIVVSMVHPCGSCVTPSINANNIVKNYATSNPGKVLFYIIDGNNNCTSLATWKSTYGLGSVTSFSNSSVYNSSYYSPAMPTIMVISGANRAISGRQDNGLNTTNLTNAINAALVTSGISEEQKSNFQMSVYPNPATDKLSVNYFLNQTLDVRIDLYNMLGAKVSTVVSEKQTAGKHETEYNFEQLSNGVYFLKLYAGDASQIIRFTVSH